MACIEKESGRLEIDRLVWIVIAGGWETILARVLRLYPDIYNRCPPLIPTN